MDNLIKLENKINKLGFFPRQIELIISLKSEFEGFYGKASEDWEQQVVIEIKSPDENIIKNIRVVGKRFEKINDVAGRVLDILKK